MEEVQIKIKQLQDMIVKMQGADGVDPKEFSEIQSEMQQLDSRWTTVKTDSESEEQR